MGDDITLFMDGGVRSGLDVLKALALGAKACFLGRAWAYGVAARGEAGVSHVLDIMRGELTTALGLTGCIDVRKVGRDLLVDAHAALTEVKASAGAKPTPRVKARAAGARMAAE